MQHVIPRIRGWTTELLKEREEDEMKEADFSLGRVTTQLDENELGGAEMSIRVAHPPTTEDVVAEGDAWVELAYMRGVWAATKHIEDGFKMLAKKLNQVPPEIRNKDSFRITCDTLRRAFRLNENDFDPVESMMQSQSAHYSAAEDWAESLKSLLDAADEMDILENKDEYPSFSLGFDSSQVSTYFTLFVV